MQIIVAIDKFKGSLTSLQAAEAVKRGLLKRQPNALIKIFPVADGGDGFDEVIRYYFSLEAIESESIDPLGRPIKAGWTWDPGAKTAFISVAAASGLALLSDSEKNPMFTSSEGTGWLIKDAIAHGAKKIVLGLGGSASNDAGLGILAALGFQFLDAAGQPLAAIGGNLEKVNRIVRPAIIPNIVFDIATDVVNPLYGPTGAAWVYAAQKGADEFQIQSLDQGLRSIGKLLEKEKGEAFAGGNGMGAAGGIAAGLFAFFEVRIQPGIDWVLKASGLEKLLNSTHLLITGEGRLDKQSTQGKVVGRLAEIARLHGVKTAAVCGKNELSSEALKEAGIGQVLEIRSIANSEQEAISEAAILLERLAASLII